MPKVIKEAFKTSIPIMAGYIFLGIGFGILLRGAGYGPLWAFLMSLTIYGGTMQYVGVDLLATQASILTSIVTTVMIASRQFFYSIAILDKFKDGGKYKPYLVLSLTDETYALICDGHYPEGENPYRYRFWLSAFNHSYWIIGGLIGNALGAALPFNTAGVEYSMTALFIAALTEQWITSSNRTSAVVGLIGTFICLLVFGSENFLIPAMLLITLVLTLFRKKLERGEAV